MDPWFETNLYGHLTHSPVYSMVQRHKKWKQQQQHPTAAGSSVGSDGQSIGPNTSHGLHSHFAPTSSAGQVTSLPHHPIQVVSTISRWPIRQLSKSSVDVNSSDSSTSRPVSTTPKPLFFTAWSGHNNSANTSYGPPTSAGVGDSVRTASATEDKQKQRHSRQPSSVRQIKPAHVENTKTVASSTKQVATARLNSSLTTTRMSSGGAVEKHPSSHPAIPIYTASLVPFSSSPPPARYTLPLSSGNGSTLLYSEPTRHLNTRTLGSVAPVRGSQKTIIAESDSTSDAIRPSTSLPSSRDQNIGYKHQQSLNSMPSAANLHSKTTTASDSVSAIHRFSDPKRSVGAPCTSLIPPSGLNSYVDPMYQQALYIHQHQPYHPNYLYPAHFPHLVNPLDPYSNCPCHLQHPLNSLDPYPNYLYSPLLNPLEPNQNYPYPSYFPHPVNPFDPVFQSMQSNGGMLPPASVYGQLTLPMSSGFQQQPIVHPAFNQPGGWFVPPPLSLAVSEAYQVGRE